jgi:hypothetical protein
MSKNVIRIDGDGDPRDGDCWRRTASGGSEKKGGKDGGGGDWTSENGK